MWEFVVKVSGVIQAIVGAVAAIWLLTFLLGLQNSDREVAPEGLIPKRWTYEYHQDGQVFKRVVISADSDIYRLLKESVLNEDKVWQPVDDMRNVPHYFFADDTEIGISNLKSLRRGRDHYVVVLSYLDEKGKRRYLRRELYEPVKEILKQVGKFPENVVE